MFERLAAQALTDLRHDGFAPGQIRMQRALDMRYAGQGYEITIPCGSDPLRNGDLDTLRGIFDAQHKSMFGHAAPEEPVEIVSYRVRGIGKVPPVRLRTYQPQGMALKDALRETRPCRFAGKTIDTPVYQRERLDAGISFAGPAIIDQLDCTTVIPPGQTARVDEFKNIVIARRA
jgi:N-methylhydantoinase A